MKTIDSIYGDMFFIQILVLHFIIVIQDLFSTVFVVMQLLGHCTQYEKIMIQAELSFYEVY